MSQKINKKLNWPHIGNEHVKEFLERSILKKNINSAFIFNGPDNLGKTTVSHFFSEVLLGEKIKNHSDFLEIKLEKDKKNISIEQVRKFIGKLSLSSFMGSYKIGIIKHADKLSCEAANALLKTLEEPRKKVVIILITEDYDALPQTIVSRSQVLEFRPIKTELIYDFLINELKASRSRAKVIARLSLGRPALAAKFFEDDDFLEAYTLKVKKFVNFFQQDINQRLKGVEEIFSNKIKGQEGVKTAKRILQIWSGVLRDLIFLKLNLGNKIQHEIARSDLDGVLSNVKIKMIPKMFRILREAEENLNANVHPRLVLENVVVRL